jgi:addiction module RelB/DinJ family antitoxin
MKSIINIKTDKEIKENAQKLSKELGLSLTDVINAALRNFIRTREVYFSAVPRMIPEFEHLIDQVEKDIKEEKNLSPSFSSVDEIKTRLDKI